MTTSCVREPVHSPSGHKNSRLRSGGRERVSSSQSVPAIVYEKAAQYREILSRKSHTSPMRRAIIVYLCKVAPVDHPEIAPHIALFRELLEGK